MIAPTMANHPNRGKQAQASNPKPAEIRAGRELAGLTQSEAAAVVYSTLRTWQDWEAEGQTNRRMHPAIWELWLLKTAHLRGGKKS